MKTILLFLMGFLAFPLMAQHLPEEEKEVRFRNLIVVSYYLNIPYSHDVEAVTPRSHVYQGFPLNGELYLTVHSGSKAEPGPLTPESVFQDAVSFNLSGTDGVNLPANIVRSTPKPQTIEVSSIWRSWGNPIP